METIHQIKLVKEKKKQEPVENHQDQFFPFDHVSSKAKDINFKKKKVTL